MKTVFFSRLGFRIGGRNGRTEQYTRKMSYTQYRPKVSVIFYNLKRKKSERCLKLPTPLKEIISSENEVKGDGKQYTFSHSLL